jgi:hypothetical protein
MRQLELAENALNYGDEADVQDIAQMEARVKLSIERLKFWNNIVEDELTTKKIKKLNSISCVLLLINLAALLAQYMLIGYLLFEML